jgi:hypothetical protein
MKRAILLLAVALICAANILLFSCGNDKGNILTSNAVIVWRGEYEVDGCGFFVEINNSEFKPINEDVIDDMYKSTGKTDVIIKYELCNQRVEKYCGDSPHPLLFDEIRIISIKKR